MPLTLLPVCFSGSHLSTCNLWTVGLAIRILDVLFHARIVRGPNGVVSRSQAVGRFRPPLRPVVCSQLRPHPPRQPAGGLRGTVPSIRSRAAVLQSNAEPLKDPRPLRSHPRREILENAGTAHSVVFTFSHDKQPEATPPIGSGLLQARTLLRHCDNQRARHVTRSGSITPLAFVQRGPPRCTAQACLLG